MSSPGEFHCACDPALGWVFGCSRTGSSHRKNGRPCEDAFALWSGSSGAVPSLAFAIADGHGDSRHDLSRTGAALGVQAAIEEMVTYNRIHLSDSPQHAIRAEFKTDFPRRVSRRWREMVTEDAEQRMSDTIQRDDTVRSVFTRYGSTLLAASVIADTVLIGQIGDGDIVLVRPDGSIECPIPGDPLLLGNETRSLSSPDAHLLWRSATLDRGEGGVLVAATDGVSDSFDGSDGFEFLKFIRSLVSRIDQYGVESVAGSLISWLDRYSALASGDDMTLVFVIMNPTNRGNITREPAEGDREESSWGF